MANLHLACPLFRFPDGHAVLTGNLLGHLLVSRISYFFSDQVGDPHSPADSPLYRGARVAPAARITAGTPAGPGAQHFHHLGLPVTAVAGHLPRLLDRNALDHGPCALALFLMSDLNRVGLFDRFPDRHLDRVLALFGPRHRHLDRVLLLDRLPRRHPHVVGLRDGFPDRFANRVMLSPRPLLRNHHGARPGTLFVLRNALVDGNLSLPGLVLVDRLRHHTLLSGVAGNHHRPFHHHRLDTGVTATAVTAGIHRGNRPHQQDHRQDHMSQHHRTLLSSPKNRSQDRLPPRYRSVPQATRSGLRWTSRVVYIDCLALTPH